ncbi:MAG: histidinol-phosphate transaminase [Nitrospiraceae bacterium]|nr:histidinol-phosphate transaminase [Nitrospiraceae bacterium]
MLYEVPKYITDLVPYPPGKPIEEVEREYGIKGPIKLASNENPLGPSPKAQEAISKALSSIHRYPDGSCYYLKKRLSQLLGVSPEEIVVGNGSDDLIEFLIRVFVRPGREVITSRPSFLVYTKMVQVVGGTNVVIPLSEYHHDLEAISQAVTPKTRLIFLDNPNNPTGSTIHQEDFDAFLKGLPDHLLVVLDEAYIDFTRTKDTPKGTDYINKDERVVALRTFSKSYGLAGLRVGYGVMDKRVAGYLDRVRQPFNVNSLAQVGALAALDDQEHFENTLNTVWQGMDFLKEALEEMGLNVMPSETNFILVDIGRDACVVYEDMLRQGIIIRTMSVYGLPNYIRITVGLPDENSRCIEALRKALSDDR